jgi:hypothetical protein
MKTKKFSMSILKTLQENQVNKKDKKKINKKKKKI